jgi:hypothetical protein
MQIAKNIAKIEQQESEYRVVVTVERLNGEKITREGAEIVLTRVMPTLFTQKQRFRG